DVDTLKTLPENEIRSGYAEIVKEAYIADESFLIDLLNTDLAYINDDLLMKHLYKGIQIKAQIVEADERESNVRKYLNFGHTLAHAIERELEYGTIAHGEAVAIGMLFALKLTQQAHQGEFYAASYLNWLKLNEFPLHIILNHAERLVTHMQKDKKTH